MQRVESATDALSYQGQGMGVMSYMPSGDEDIVTKARNASAVTWWAASSIAVCIGFLLHSGADVRRPCRSR